MDKTDFTLTKDLLNEVFDYNGETLYWKISTKGHRVGQEAGSVASGYYCVKFNNKLYKAHRLIYLMVHGVLPDLIDHVDGNPLNNKIENLRAATKAENGFNRKINKNSSTGVKGVSWDGQSKKYKARCWVNKKVHTLGLFNTIEEAAIVVKSARERLHGEFARHS
jgi:hypothetical protein